jgi:adenylate cyclase
MSDRRSERRLAAIMAADVVNYSRLLGADEAGTLEQLRALRHDVIDPLMLQHDGRIFKTMGDGLLAEFPSAVRALSCAIEIQKQLRTERFPLQLRIGLHQGDVLIDGDDVLGDGVNIAARLEPLAKPGGICISARVRDDAAGKIILDVDDLGKLRLKNIATPVQAFVVRLDPASAPVRLSLRFARTRQFALGGATVAVVVIIIIIGASAVWRSRDRLPKPVAMPAASLVVPAPGAALAPAPTTSAALSNPSAVPEFGSPRAAPLSIVVLPFANLNDDPEQEYFADAITDDLTTDLSRISGSFVIAYTTAQTYRDKPLDVRRIGHDLDVRYVLEGSVRRMAERVAVNAQLIDTNSGAHVWAERFEADRRNLYEEQREITGRLARTLNLELLEAAGHWVEKEKNVDPDASDLVMRGWVMWFRPLSVATHEEARRAFERALEIDPRSVDAKIGVATVLVSNVGTGLSHSPQQDGGRAERLLLEAIEQDANSSRAHEALGALRRIQNRLTEARIEYETSVSLDRNNAHALLGLGQTLMFLGRPEDAVPMIESSIRLDPRDPNAAFGDWSLGTCLMLLGHVDRAADLLRKARAENPRVYYFQIYLAGALGLRGDIDEARAALAEVVRLKPEANSLAGWSTLQPWTSNPAFAALRANTLDVGLRRAGMPDH